MAGRCKNTGFALEQISRVVKIPVLTNMLTRKNIPAKMSMRIVVSSTSKILRYLQEAKRCTTEIRRYTANVSREDYLTDTDDAKMRRYAVAYLYIKLGESAKRVTKDCTELQSNIDLSHLAKFKDILTHQYEHVDHGVVYDAATTELDRHEALIKQISETIVVSQE
jgi:uncharacterized protein with HEPN domain